MQLQQQQGQPIFGIQGQNVIPAQSYSPIAGQNAVLAAQAMQPNIANQMDTKVSFCW